MKLLVDEALQNAVALRPTEAGATHVRLLGLAGTPMTRSWPLRCTMIEYELSQGAVVVIEEDRYRIRYLPIDDA